MTVGVVFTPPTAPLGVPGGVGDLLAVLPPTLVEQPVLEVPGVHGNGEQPAVNVLVHGGGEQFDDDVLVHGGGEQFDDDMLVHGGGEQFDDDVLVHGGGEQFDDVLVHGGGELLPEQPV